MKIKTKKQLNLPQLIEWAWDNPEQSQYKMFEKIGATMRDYVSFNSEENGVRLNGTVKPADIFTVEVEEEITEDTKFRHIVFIDDCDLSASYENNSINDIKYGKDKEFHAYIDGKFKLIWRNGKLVE